VPVATLVNGTATDRVAATDRGLLYGDGVFETMAIDNGRAASWPRHMARLQAGCARLGIPAVDTVLLARETERLLAGTQQAVLKVIVTRGSGGRGYRVAEEVMPRRILQLHPWPDIPAVAREQGVAVRLCATRLCHNPVLAGIKHLNRLEQVMAAREWSDPLIREGLLLDTGDSVVEGTMSNLFIVSKGRLLTPDLRSCGVAGIMRSVVIDMARTLSLDVEIRRVDAAELPDAEELFLCNTLIGIWPVTAVDGRPCRKGPVTNRLQESLLLHEDTGNTWHI